MKKIFMIIISALLIVLLGLGAIGYYVEKDEAAQAEEIKTEEKIENEEEETNFTINEDKLDISKIENYTIGENLSISGVTLPYTIYNKNMDIISIGEYYGKFMEDGSDSKKTNVLAVVIKNTSDKVISYGEVKLKITGTSKTAKFIVTNLKPNSAALVMESTGTVEFNAKDKYQYISGKSTMEDSLSLMEDKIDVTTKGKKITVKNKSDKNLDTVYVYYKVGTKGNCYLGGITYRVKFENVKSGKSKTENTLHFSSENSEIVKVETISKTK